MSDASAPLEQALAELSATTALADSTAASIQQLVAQAEAMAGQALHHGEAIQAELDALGHELEVLERTGEEQATALLEGLRGLAAEAAGLGEAADASLGEVNRTLAGLEQVCQALEGRLVAWVEEVHGVLEAGVQSAGEALGALEGQLAGAQQALSHVGASAAELTQAVAGQAQELEGALHGLGQLADQKVTSAVEALQGLSTEGEARLRGFEQDLEHAAHDTLGSLQSLFQGAVPSEVGTAAHTLNDALGALEGVVDSVHTVVGGPAKQVSDNIQEVLTAVRTIEPVLKIAEQLL